MTDVLKHRFTSPKLDGADTQQVQPSHWNDGHKFQGGNAGEVLTRDPADLSFGAKWTPITIPPAVQEVPGGGINGDVLRRDLAIPTFQSKWAAPFAFIDAAFPGTVNDYLPGLAPGALTTIMWDAGGTTPATLTGIAGGTPGQILTVRNRGAGLLTLPFFSSGSLQANRFANVVSSGPTILAGGGWAQFVYRAWWEMIGYEQGQWITPAYSAADYFADSGMTWTVEAGDVVLAKYRLAGRTMNWAVWIYLSALSITTANQLVKRKLFGGLTSTGEFPFIATLSDNGVVATGLGSTSGTNINFYHDAGGASLWVAGNVNLNASGVCEVT